MAWPTSSHVRRTLPILLASILVQLLLAVFLGHAYDQRIFMATGYLVGTGQNPYLAQDLSQVFGDPSFKGITSLGYPPPWALILGGLYRLVFPYFPNVLAYNLAIKIPIIVANIGLAYAVAAAIRTAGGAERASKRAWTFTLFNPLLLYFGAAWGQFDAIVAWLSLAALTQLHAGRHLRSAAWLALAMSFKPTCLALLPVSLAYMWSKSRGRTLGYLAAFAGGTGVFVVAPFIAFGWSPEVILRHWDAHMRVAGGMSLLTILELVRGSYDLPPGWTWLGFLWLPALALGLLTLRGGIHDFVGLLEKATGLTLIFFLTRAWLSEPNVILLLPFVMILVACRRLGLRTLGGLCLLPLVFTIFNTSPPQLLFPSFPRLGEAGLALADRFRVPWLVIRTLTVLPWQGLGWWIVSRCLRRGPPAAPDPTTFRDRLASAGAPPVPGARALLAG